MIDEREKIAWVYGYLKANFDMFTEMGYSSKAVGKSMEFITERVFKRLGINNERLAQKIIREINGLDLELTISKVIDENRDSANGKTFSINF